MLKTSSFANHLQNLEQMVLVGVGAASLKMGVPTMCNGANLAFRKNAFREVDGYVGNEDVPSGDDEFLMHKIFSRYGKNAVKYHFGSGSSVVTQPVMNTKEFVSQRKRWGSKWPYYKLKRTKLFSAFIFLFHFSQIYFLTGLFFGLNAKLFLGFFLIRMLLELALLSRSSFLIGGRIKILPFLVMSVGYSFYVIVFGIFGTFGKYKWKSRKYT
jgi:cellulose synthase/poly-beta-1,6-N-acetylglucosamine synthase-like glycosyltransferase